VALNGPIVLLLLSTLDQREWNRSVWKEASFLARCSHIKEVYCNPREDGGRADGWQKVAAAAFNSAASFFIHFLLLLLLFYFLPLNV
jgi:hypothetical protein